MLRLSRIHQNISNICTEERFEQISIILPLIILIVEIVLIVHALDIQEAYVIALTTFLLVVSIIELILVTKEVTDQKSKRNFDSTLTIRLDDFINKTKNSNVKDIMNTFIEKYPIYRNHRVDIYKLCCKILQTHQDELVEIKYNKKIIQFLNKTDKKHLSEIVEEFIFENPEYEGYALDIYEKISQILHKKEKK